MPVVVVSTDGTESRMRRMLALGARGYVKKPFLPETLRAGAGARAGRSLCLITNWIEMLAAASAEVLETMFFTGVRGIASEAARLRPSRVVARACDSKARPAAP